MNIMGIVELHSTLFALVPLSNILVCLDFCPWEYLEKEE
jgi:hypothetical protein